MQEVRTKEQGHKAVTLEFKPILRPYSVASSQQQPAFFLNIIHKDLNPFSSLSQHFAVIQYCYAMTEGSTLGPQVVHGRFPVKNRE